MGDKPNRFSLNSQKKTVSFANLRREAASASIVAMQNAPSPFFSVIMPVFRAETTLRRAAESLRAQSDGDWETVLVDDGSPDSSGAIARELAAEDARFRFVSHPENRGTHEARRTGVAAAQGEWVLFLDPDDLLAPGLLARLRKRIARKPVDLLRFDFDWKDPATADPALVRFYASGRCSGREASGAGCALPLFFTGANVPLLFPAFAFRAPVCKAAFARMDSIRLVYAEDIYEFFAVASFADSYGEEPFPGYVYDAGSGGITSWRIEKDRNPETYAAGYFENIGKRLASFAAMARWARSFRGPALRAVRHAMRRERRRVLVGTIPWEFSVLAAVGVSRREALRRVRQTRAFAPLLRKDRAFLRFMLALRPILESMGVLPQASRLQT